MILVSRRAADRLQQAGNWGQVVVRRNTVEEFGAVTGVSTHDGSVLPVPLEPTDHVLTRVDGTVHGMWYRVDPFLHVLWLQTRARSGTALNLDVFKESLKGGFRIPGPDPYIALTCAHQPEAAFPGLNLPDIVAWAVSRDGAQPLIAQVEAPTTGIAQLQEHWPVSELQDAHVALVGTGSIGSAAAHALAGYGIGRLTLIDPDRLAWHNLIRHTSASRQVGRLKVNALTEELTAKYPDTRFRGHPWDVLAHADHLRSLLPNTNLIVCAADGVAPRRVISHLTRRAGRTAVLACVLQDGAIGEILRLRPWAEHGCLVCRRNALRHANSLDPEPDLDAGYGTGTRHRPMTAIGSDLHLVGQFAAKAAVATILEGFGQTDQRLPGEHALIALRRQPDCAPPFDLQRTGEVRWLPATPPEPHCPTCGV
ncbi:ThiF family adenylyltransferase [Kitasatospora sp. NPDC036755]|uniref:HesA/MoeB/ThiF family protein n=1 Tax=Kitasatospora sp. NPDC036755 TaxID=3154600 RepID=UPI0033C8F965